MKPIEKLQEAKRQECLHNLRFLLKDDRNAIHFDGRVAIRTTIALLESYGETPPQGEPRK